MKKYFSAVLSILLTLCVCCGAVLLAHNDIVASAPSLSQSRADDAALPVIIVDPGHGGFDGGAVSVNGKNEKDYNLPIALKLADILKASGFTVVMTRTEDEGTQDAGLDTIRQKKVSDIKNRLELIHSYDNCVFVSIHQNYYSDSSCRGAQIFYSPNLPESKDVASVIQKNIITLLQPYNTRSVKKADGSIYLLKNAKRPAVLIECGFISNYDDVKNLEDETYQKKLVFAISNAICNYFFYSEE